MRRFSVLLLLIVVVLIGIVGLHAPAVAQDATPAADEMAGITFEPLTFATGVDVTGPVDLFVVRVGLEPGAALPIDETDPTVGFVLVESGTSICPSDGFASTTLGESVSGPVVKSSAPSVR